MKDIGLSGSCKAYVQAEIDDVEGYCVVGLYKLFPEKQDAKSERKCNFAKTNTAIISCCPHGYKSAPLSPSRLQPRTFSDHIDKSEAGDSEATDREK